MLDSSLRNVFIPITSPLASTKGPPLFPGFTAASVWIMLSNTTPLDWTPKSALLALIIPKDAIGSFVDSAKRLKGLPKAITNSPTDKLSELPRPQ